MKSVLVIMLGVVLGLTTLGAENTNAILKQEISNTIDYPKFAKDNLVEGTVWLQVSVDDNSKVKVVYWSATNVELGRYVNEKVNHLVLNSKDLEKGKVHDFKFKFELTNRN